MDVDGVPLGGPGDEVLARAADRPDGRRVALAEDEHVARDAALRRAPARRSRRWLKPDWGRASAWSSTMTAIGWRAASGRRDAGARQWRRDEAGRRARRVGRGARRTVGLGGDGARCGRRRPGRGRERGRGRRAALVPGPRAPVPASDHDGEGARRDDAREDQADDPSTHARRHDTPPAGRGPRRGRRRGLSVTGAHPALRAPGEETPDDR